jgi:hypothetical protein
MPVLVTATVSKNQRSPHEIAELLSHFSSLSRSPSPVVSLSSLSPEFHFRISRVSSRRMTNCSIGTYIVPVSSILQPLHFWDFFYDFIHEDGKTDACLFPCQFLDFVWKFIHGDEKLMLTYVSPVSSILKPQPIFGFLLRFHP